LKSGDDKWAETLKRIEERKNKHPAWTYGAVYAGGTIKKNTFYRVYANLKWRKTLPPLALYVYFCDFQ
jgi:hypothetical protein